MDTANEAEETDLNREFVMFIRSQRSYVEKEKCMHANKRKTGHNDNIRERAREKNILRSY